MKRLSIYFLAFLTFWLSTWMVTDIHDWSKSIDQSHPVFSIAEHGHGDHILTTNTDNPAQHDNCNGVCSYDHGGHTGHSYPPLYLSLVFNLTPSGIQQTELNSRYFHHNPPSLRPPIA